jgi:uncharacterized paraquat-inducible protein A
MLTPKSDLRQVAGMKGTVEHCATCKQRTPHMTEPGRWPVCVRCGTAGGQAAGDRRAR